MVVAVVYKKRLAIKKEMEILNMNGPIKTPWGRVVVGGVDAVGMSS